MLDLSEQFGAASDLRQVAFRGLRIPACKVEKQINDNPNDITSAAYKVLRDWLPGQPNKEIVRENLIHALKKAKKSLWLEFVE